MDKLENQTCPLCRKKTLTLTEDEIEIPYFGKAFTFSMNCSSCDYKMSDVEAEQPKEPTRQTFEITSTKDMNIRVVKSSEATIKIPQLKMSMESGSSSIGFVSNIEGLLERFEKVIKDQKEVAEEEEVKKHAKNLLKKLWRVKCGDEKLKIVIEDPSGNSAIISKNTIIEKLKK